MMAATTGVLVRPAIPTGIGGRLLAAALASVLVTASIGQAVRVLGADPPAPPVVPPAAAVSGSLVGLPMAWAANTGQSDPTVRYLAQGAGYAAFLTDTEAVVRLDGAVVRLGFDGAAEAPGLSIEKPLAATVSSFTGSDASGWQTGAATAEVVRYEEAWPGIDMTVRGTGSRLEWDLHVDAGADPGVAGMTVTGGDRIEVDGDRARLVIGASELPLSIPAVWQTRPDGTRLDRTARWDLEGDTLRVVPQAWDPALPGVVDPTIDWATYLGGSPGGDGGDRGNAIAVDASGNSYVTGLTFSLDFPTTPGAFDTSLNSQDVFVTKVDPTGATLLYSTVFGGSERDEGLDLAVDGAGRAHITGVAAAGGTAFPTTAGAFDTTPNGGTSEAFVVKLDAAGENLLYSTFLGSSAGDRGNGITLDASGTAYVTGFGGTGFPTTPGAFDTTGPGAFITKLDATGSTLLYSTMLDGSTGMEIAVDGGGSAFVTGPGGPDTPTTPGAYDTTTNGSGDVFVAKLDAAGSSIVYSTLLGGTLNDVVHGIAIDGAGHAYVTGETPSLGAVPFPATPGAYDETPQGLQDVFVTKLDLTGSALVYSTRIGGSGDDRGRDIAVDGTGHAFVTGSTADSTTTFPTTAGAFDTTPKPIDAFVTKLEPDGSALDYSTLLGGLGSDVGYGIAVDSAGAAHVTGGTGSPVGSGAFPTTPGAFDTTYAGGGDVFVTKVDPAGADLEFSTLVGGRDGEGADAVDAVAVDASGVYAAGVTESSYFPTTGGPLDNPPGNSDVFVTKLDPTGTSLVYSMVLGPVGHLDGTGIAVDAEGEVYVVGSTTDPGFPTTPGAFDPAHEGSFDVFVTKIDAAGTSLVYSTFLGGTGYEVAEDVAVDASGAAYVTGYTSSGAFPGEPYPTTAGAYDTTHNGGGEYYPDDAFVTKIDPSGSALEYSTFLGGASVDAARSVAVDAAGSAYVVGDTTVGLTVPFPTTPGAHDTTHNDTPPFYGTDAFVTKLDTSGSDLVFSTLLGGSGHDRANGVAVGSDGGVFVTGYGASAFPATPGTVDATGPGAYVARFNSVGSELIYSTFVPGSEGQGVVVDDGANAYVASGGYAHQLDPAGGSFGSSTLLGTGYVQGLDIARTPAGRVVVGGTTSSPDLPTPGAFDTTVALWSAGFVSVLDLSVPPSVAPSGCNYPVVSGGTIGWFPANPGAVSGLRVACSFGNNPGSSQVSSSFTVHDANVAQFHNGAGRRVTNQSALVAGATSIQLATGSNGIAGVSGWVNRPITGPGIAAGTFVRLVSGAGVASLSRPLTGAVPAGQTFTLDNASARRVDDASGAPASTTLTSPTANFTAADVGLSVSGTGIPAGTTIASVASVTQVVLSAPASLVGSTVTIGVTLVSTSTRQITGATTVSGVRIGSTAAKWAPSDGGLKVSGVCSNGAAADYVIPANVYIASPPSGATTEAATTGGLLAGQTGCNLTIGEPSGTAPLDGEPVASQSMQLDLNPAIVPGVGACAQNQPEALAFTGSWHNPGSFQGAGLSHQQPGQVTGAPSKALAQIYFDSGPVDFSVFVIERPAGSPNDPIGVSHYDLQVPFLPAASVMCPGTGTSPGMAFSMTVHAVTPSQTASAQGTGRPGTNQVRSIRTTASGGYNATAYVRSDTGITFTPATAFSRLCVYPTGPTNPINFQCGPG